MSYSKVDAEFYRERRDARGLCNDCGKPRADGLSRCTPCNESHKARDRRNRRKRRLEKLRARRLQTSAAIAALGTDE